MQTPNKNVRGEASLKVLWKWTAVSAVFHAILIGGLCGFSYWSFHQREHAAQAKQATADAAAKKLEAAEAAKAPATPAPAAAPTEPAPATTPAEPSREAKAEKVLGIDKVAKPDEIPKSPFSGDGDDLLKDLK